MQQTLMFLIKLNVTQFSARRNLLLPFLRCLRVQLKGCTGTFYRFTNWWQPRWNRFFLFYNNRRSCSKNDRCSQNGDQSSVLRWRWWRVERLLTLAEIRIPDNDRSPGALVRHDRLNYRIKISNLKNNTD